MLNKISQISCDRCGASSDMIKMVGAERWLYPSEWVMARQGHDNLYFCSFNCAIPQIEELHADEWFDIKGRGRVAVCTLNNDGYQPWTWMTARLSLGAKVQIDDRMYTIKGVEHFMTGSMHPYEQVGILAELLY